MQQLTPEQLEDLAAIFGNYWHLVKDLQRQNSEWANSPDQKRRVELAETLIHSIHCGKVELKYECPDESALII